MVSAKVIVLVLNCVLMLTAIRASAAPNRISVKSLDTASTNQECSSSGTSTCDITDSHCIKVAGTPF